MSERILDGSRTDFQAGRRVCALPRLCLSVIASAAIGGAGDGIQPEKTERLALEAVVSRAAIAAVIARGDLASGERLVAFSLASFGGRDNRAWPGTPAAAARAGLSRSRYLQTREALARRRLIVVDERAAGRGRASTIALAFAEAGPWWEGEINVELFELVDSCEGFLALEVWHSDRDAGEVIMVSRWSTREAFTAYMKSEDH
jgi:antibiotic biosynthesis monooxygenase